MAANPASDLKQLAYDIVRSQIEETLRDRNARRWNAFEKNFSGYTIELENGLIKYEDDKYVARKFGDEDPRVRYCESLSQAIDFMFGI